MYYSIDYSSTALLVQTCGARQARDMGTTTPCPDSGSLSMRPTTCCGSRNAASNKLQRPPQNIRAGERAQTAEKVRITDYEYSSKRR